MIAIDYENAALCLKTLANPQRLEIVHYLIEKKRCSVGEIAEEFSLPNNVASEHLTLMKDRGLLQSTRDGRKVYYTISEPTLKNIMNCIKKRFSYD